MTTQLKKRIAKAMGIDESQITHYRKQEDGTYTVLLTNFQKFKGVVPAEPKPEPKKTDDKSKKRTTASKHQTRKS